MNANKYIDSLTPEAQRELYGKIIYGLHVEADEIDDDWVNAMLKWVVPVLNEMDDEDAWGTQGWKYNFGVDED